MTIGARQHPAERLVDWAAPAILAAAAGWAVWKLSGMSIASLGASTFALALGLAAMQWVGRSLRAEVEAAFEPAPFEAFQGDDELLLDDPLIEIEPDSRVVRLFEHQEATPGELVARIADYLGDGRIGAVPAREGSAAPPDASAALHAALANIRASLR